MAPHRDIRLTKSQALHERVMRAVALRMQSTSCVFKGGTALALLYGLDRHSTDIDFDGDGPVYLKNDICDGLEDANVSMSAFIPGKPTGKGQRFKIHYIDPESGRDRLVKVDLSFRTEPSADDIVVLDGIRTYKSPALFDQKMDAAEDRTKSRDLYDLGFLAGAYGDSFSTEQVLRAEEFSRDYQGLADRFRFAFETDLLLKKVSTADDRALLFRIAVIEQMHRRGQSVLEQAVPRTRSLADVLAGHRIWLESDGREGCRADLSETKFTGAVLCGVDFEKADLQRADFTGADLRNANLRNTNLREAVFDGTDLQGANFSGADLSGFSLRKSTLGPNTKGLAEAPIKVAKPNRSPSVPDRPVRRRAELERDFGASR